MMNELRIILKTKVWSARAAVFYMKARTHTELECAQLPRSITSTISSYMPYYFVSKLYIPRTIKPQMTFVNTDKFNRKSSSGILLCLFSNLMHQSLLFVVSGSFGQYVLLKISSFLLKYLTFRVFFFMFSWTIQAHNQRFCTLYSIRTKKLIKMYILASKYVYFLEPKYLC